MNFLYITPQGFAHGVRWRDALIRAWAKRTGRVDRYGNMAYNRADLPAYYDVPTNEERSMAQAIEFRLKPLPRGESYVAYLSNDKRITTWSGETLANVTRITSYRAATGSISDPRGSFWAIGIDGRTYYGTHNGTGMYCRMRLAKYRTEFDIQQCTPDCGWETVTTESTRREAQAMLNAYRGNAPGVYRIKRMKVKQ